MPPARTTIPIRAVTNAPCDGALPLEICQSCTQQVQASALPIILLVEQQTESTPTLELAIAKTTGWSVIRVESSRDAVTTASLLGTQLKIVVITTGRNYGDATRLIRELHEVAVTNRNECPRILALSLASQEPSVALDFEKHGAEYLLRAYQDQVLEVIRKMQWLCRSKRSFTTIVIFRTAGHVTDVRLENRMGKRLRLGPRLRKLVEFCALHAHTEYGTQMIADALDISRQSVKQYLRLLRGAYNEAKGVQTGPSGAEVFWTKKIGGGYVHGVKARFEIIDENEF